jgi:hypothetical protein
VVAFGITGWLAAVAADAVTHGRLITAFLESTAGRSLQLESLGGGLLLLATWYRAGAVVSKEHNHNWTLHGSGADAVAAVSTAAPLVAIGVVLAIALRATKRETMSVRTFATIATALITTLLVSNKVLSPQYLVWIIPFAPLLHRRQAWLIVLISVLTTIVFPLMYWDLIAGEGPVVCVLNLRNALLVGLIVDLLRSLRPPRAASPSATAASPTALSPAWKGALVGAGAIAIAVAVHGYRPYPWRARFYPSPDFSGQPVVRFYRQLQLMWDLDPPHARIPADHFTAQFDTCLRLAKRTKLTFEARADDGVRIRVDGASIADAWDEGVHETTGAADLIEGAHHVEVDYAESGGLAELHVDMTPAPTGDVVELIRPRGDRDPCVQ